MDIEQLRREIAALSAEADARRRVVDELIARRQYREQLVQLDMQLDLSDPFEDARMEIAKAAFLLVNCVEQRSPMWPDRVAADEYRRVLEHFPNTDAAQVAQIRLNELTNSEGAL